MTVELGHEQPNGIPKWVPDAARHYLAHTEIGLSIRAVARANDCHPSTVLRQVRRFEVRRDDPLIDAALTSLSNKVSADDDSNLGKVKGMNQECWKSEPSQVIGLTQERIDQDAKRVLRRLCEQGAVLAVANEMESSVVFREATDGQQIRTAIVETEIAQAMALKDWISCPNPGRRLSKYFITNAGRAALRRLTAEDDNRASGFSEKRQQFVVDADWDISKPAANARQSMRYQVTESPLSGLARRKDRDGQPFLKRELVAVGERLREDFELAQVGMPVVESWDALMSEEISPSTQTSHGALAARKRVKDALRDLGPGLGDIVLRCCCFLEGLEQTEKSMGWSARSGKIVLRIALQRLARHFEETQGKYGPMIG